MGKSAFRHWLLKEESARRLSESGLPRRSHKKVVYKCLNLKITPGLGTGVLTE